MRYWIVLLLSFTLQATEIDSFTGRYESLADSTTILNNYVNQELEIAINKVNSKINCQLNPKEAELQTYDLFYDQVGGYLWADIENLIVRNNFVEKRIVRNNNSIYRDLNWINSPVLKFAELGALININGNLIGSDKIGHFMAIGWQYFKIAAIQDFGIERAINIGKHSEKTFFGELTTGVYSYADLVSNYDGYRFWKRLFNSKISPHKSPYLNCEKGQLVFSELFDWRDYVNLAWDEAVNCNDYRDRFIEKKVMRRVLELEQKDPGNSYQCPIRSCGSLHERYPEFHLNCQNL